jgi:hypothetical protein
MKGLVEVYEVEDGRMRPGFGYKPGCIALLSPDKPLPNVGDIIILPQSATGDTKEQAYYYGMAAPFRMLEREHLYMPTDDDGRGARPVPYEKTWIHVRRLTLAEYERVQGPVHTK